MRIQIQIINNIRKATRKQAHRLENRQSKIELIIKDRLNPYGINFINKASNQKNQ